MAGTRTAPAATGAANKFVTSISLVDASGDSYSVAIITGTAPTGAAIEAFAASYQAATQASVYQIRLESVWIGAKETDNAESDIRYQVENGINMLFRSADLLSSSTVRVIAPVPAAMDGDDDIPLPGVAPLTGVATDAAAINGGTFESAQYTTRRERKNNPRRGV